MERRPWVYLIGSYEVKPVKIGYSLEPEKRLKTLNTGSPVPLSLLWKTPGGASLEVALHNYFSPYRVYGEWFDFEDEDPIQLVVAAAARMGYGAWPARCGGPPLPGGTPEVEERQPDEHVAAGAPELLLIYPPEVVNWHASRSMPLSAGEKERAQRVLVDWLRAQVASSRMSQSEAARMLGVNASTISRWLA